MMRRRKFFWEAKRVERNTITAFTTATNTYDIPVPENATQLDVSIRLLFRTFPPYLLRDIGLDQYLENLIIFEMNTEEYSVTVN